MLKIYICPHCYNFRIVSRKPDAVCFHCGMILEQCDLDYGTYMNMTEEERNEFRNNLKKRMLSYREKILNAQTIKIN
jgi:hypothetical protein